APGGRPTAQPVAVSARRLHFRCWRRGPPNFAARPSSPFAVPMPSVQVAWAMKSKKQKAVGCISAARKAPRSNDRHVPTLICSKGMLPPGCTPKEHVIHLPPRLTQSAFQTLLACHLVPRQWHLEGRFGSRTHNVLAADQPTKGIPLLYDEKIIEEKSFEFPELRKLLQTEGVHIVETKFAYNHRMKREIPSVDARIHPELEPKHFVLPNLSPNVKRVIKDASDCFTYAEMFGGIGGFGVGLDSLGGKCVFYSEIDQRCRETYSLNFDTPSTCIHGDIYQVPDEAFPKRLDLLVAGFPCQPFSTLGEQPGFDCDKGRGQLYLQIVRALKLSRPRAFLFENVPGLLGMRDELNVIVDSFRSAGYKCTAEICTARGLTATSRKRLFFVGIREDLASLDSLDSTCIGSIPPGPPTPLNNSFFQYPYVPDLKLCCHDILDYDSLPSSELDVLRLSQSTWNQLCENKRWKPHHLAWPNRHCDTLTSHYGNAVGRGDSQLVPSCAPHPPRRFSVRECARIMGFPNWFDFCDIREGQGEMAHRKEGYRMVGNAVCPPLIAALAGSVLDAAGMNIKTAVNDNWTSRGRRAAVNSARLSLRPSQVSLPAGCLVHE
ncbi:hypothetical protein ACHAWF_002592, partial [Thalassiosira exigua]